jgi:hypothetical protein
LEGGVIKPFPVVSLDTSVASGRFLLWARQFGIFRLGRSLDVNFRSVRKWLSGARQPSIDKAKEIIALSAIEPLDGQPLTFEDIYGTARAVKVEVRQVQRMQAWE